MNNWSVNHYVDPDFRKQASSRLVPEDFFRIIKENKKISKIKVAGAHSKKSKREKSGE